MESGKETEECSTKVLVLIGQIICIAVFIIVVEAVWLFVTLCSK